MDDKTRLKFFLLAVGGWGKSCIHQYYARVAAQSLFVNSDSTDSPAKMITIIRDTPRPVK